MVLLFNLHLRVFRHSGEHVVQVGTTSSMGTAVLTEAAIPSSAATIHVLSMTDKVAFEQLPQLLAGTSSAPCIMVATKCDVVQSYAITVVRHNVTLCT